MSICFLRTSEWGFWSYRSTISFPVSERNVETTSLITGQYKWTAPSNKCNQPAEKHRGQSWFQWCHWIFWNA